MRYWEVDAARGIAVLLMIAYHFVFSAQYFKTYDSFCWYWFAAPIASLFILVSGISLSISYSKGSRFLKFSKRGIKLLVLACLITFASFLLLRAGFIIFGILHFFAVSSFLIYPFLKFFKNNLSFLFFGILTILTGNFISNISTETNYFLWLGLTPRNFYSLDYFPLIPWFGVLLIGVFLGRTFYPEGKRNFKIFTFKGRLAKFITFLGRNSLIIYFIHQPIIFLVLFLLGHSEFLSALNL
jgi:uncharacterized membrane protein